MPCAGRLNVSPGSGWAVTQQTAPPIWFEKATLLWWIKDSQYPPLVTTGLQTSLGVLGARGTQVLFGGDTDNEERLGGRFTLGAWLDDDRACGLETSFLFLGQRSTHFQASSQGSPLLARPFLNAQIGAEDAEQVANLANPSLPSLLPLTGRVSISSMSRLWGLEANALRAACCDEDEDCWRLVFLGGVRYLRLDEGLVMSEDLLVPLQAAEAAGTAFHLQDDFSTRNHFYGGQLGARSELRLDHWSLDLLAKVALGVSQESVLIKGATQIASPGAPVQDYNGALLALPTNIGGHTRDRFAVIPECGATVGYQVTAHIRATLGYTFLYWSDVARPGNEINRAVNPTQLAPGRLQGPVQPAFQFVATDFWAMGLNFGLDFEF
jgi:hypothetical protein